MKVAFTVAFVAVALGMTALPALAGVVPVQVPEPGTLTMLSSAVAAGVVGYRWFRRK